jgi:hypothetical protein
MGIIIPYIHFNRITTSTTTVLGLDGHWESMESTNPFLYDIPMLGQILCPSEATVGFRGLLGFY